MRQRKQANSPLIGSPLDPPEEATNWPMQAPMPPCQSLSSSAHSIGHRRSTLTPVRLKNPEPPGMGAGCSRKKKSLRPSRTRTDGRRPQAENAASKAIMMHALPSSLPEGEKRAVSPFRFSRTGWFFLLSVLVRWALDTRPAGAGTNPLPISFDARTPSRSWPPLSVWNRAAPSSLIGGEEGAPPAGQARRPPRPLGPETSKQLPAQPSSVDSRQPGL